MRYLLGVDFGGGSSKATLINAEGMLVTSAATEYRMLYPNEGWAEQDVEEIYSAFVENVKKIFAATGISPDDIIAVSFDAGAHLGVLLDEKNRVIRNAIYWADSRSAAEADALQELREEIVRQSYNTPNPSWTLCHLMWIRKHEPENFKRIHKLIFLKDYIRFRVTGQIATDTIEIMGGMFRDETKNDWSDQLLNLCGLTRGQMPEVLQPLDIAGTPLPEVCRETGLSPKTLVVVGSTDTVMEIYASGSAKIGDTTVKLATAGKISPITDRAYADPSLYCYRHIIEELWYCPTCTKTCAQSMRWYRDVLGKHEIEEAAKAGRSAYELINDAAAKIPAGSDKLFFHPYLQGELTPYQNTKLRASFTGISSHHTKAHFGRALMEGVAYSLKDCMATFEAKKIPMAETLQVIGGGAKSPVWRQIVSDILNRPLQRVISDDSSIGSAMLAGVASGVFKSFEESIRICSRMDDVIVYPNEANRSLYDEGFAVYKEIQTAMEKIYNRL